MWRLFGMPRLAVTRAPLLYTLPNDLGIVKLCPAVLTHFNAHKQHRLWSREAGGQLFATLEKSAFTVTTVTGPRPTDKRSSNAYEPDRAAERREIEEHYLRGLHFVGDWHTHRQKYPEPSDTDLRSIRATVRESRHEMPGFLLIVVGQSPFPEGLYVSFHSFATSTVLKAAIE